MGIGNLHGIGGSNVQAFKQNRRRADHRVVRSGKAEDAMIAAGMIGCLGRQGGRVLRVVQAQLESGCCAVRLRDKLETADRDQQTLRGNGISNDDADERSPEPPLIHAEPEHAAPTVLPRS